MMIEVCDLCRREAKGKLVSLCADQAGDGRLYEEIEPHIQDFKACQACVARWPTLLKKYDEIIAVYDAAEEEAKQEEDRFEPIYDEHRAVKGMITKRRNEKAQKIQDEIDQFSWKETT